MNKAPVVRLEPSKDSPKIAGVFGSNSDVIGAVYSEILRISFETDSVIDGGAKKDQDHLDAVLYKYISDENSKNILNTYKGTNVMKAMNADFAIAIDHKISWKDSCELVPNCVDLLIKPHDMIVPNSIEGDENKKHITKLAQFIVDYATGKIRKTPENTKNAINIDDDGHLSNEVKNQNHGIIGIDGGKGAEAGNEYFLQAGKDNVEVILSSYAKTPNRINHIRGELSGNAEGVIDPLPRMKESWNNLAKAGAKVVFMACNTAHHYFQRLKESLHEITPDVKPIHVVNAGIRSIPRGTEASKGYEVVVLATSTSVALDLFPKALEERRKVYPPIAGGKIHLIFPKEENQKKVDRAIFDGVKAGNHELASKLFKEVLEDTMHRHENLIPCIITGCTEVKDGLKHISDDVKIIAFDTGGAAVKEAVEYVLKAKDKTTEVQQNVR